MDVETRLARIESHNRLLKYALAVVVIATTVGLVLLRRQPSRTADVPPGPKDWVTAVHERGRYVDTWRGAQWEVVPEDRARARRWRPTQRLAVRKSQVDGQIFEDEDGTEWFLYDATLMNVDARQVVSATSYFKPMRFSVEDIPPEPPMPEPDW